MKARGARACVPPHQNTHAHTTTTTTTTTRTTPSIPRSCGAPLPLGIDGLRVLDLGCGSGRDCYAAAALVGPAGHITGVDMTPAQLAVARQHAGAYCTDTLGYAAPNLSFVQGYMEDLAGAGIAPGSIDLAISNCVVNLSPDKPAVLRGVYDALAPGGEFYFSDVYADRRIPDAARADKVLWGECVSGALYVEDFKRAAVAAGFTYPVALAASPIAINDPDMRRILGPARFYSITFRLFKLPGGLLESCCEDYGQVATYKGTVAGSEGAYTLDSGHTFEAGRPMLVCGNTAAMVGEGGLSWLAPHFEVRGDRSVHFGKFGGGDPVRLTSDGGVAHTTQGGVSQGGGCC
jgi:SAM-dependent methyltransferase